MLWSCSVSSSTALYQERAPCGREAACLLPTASQDKQNLPGAQGLIQFCRCWLLHKLSCWLEEVHYYLQLKTDHSSFHLLSLNIVKIINTWSKKMVKYICIRYGYGDSFGLALKLNQSRLIPHSLLSVLSSLD